MTGIPYTTIRDICADKTELKKCSAETVYKLAKALDVSMEILLSDSPAERASFELFKSRICHRVKEMSDVLGILAEHEKLEQPISLEQIRAAVTSLYGDWKASSGDVAAFIENMMKDGRFAVLYAETAAGEQATKSVIRAMRDKMVFLSPFIQSIPAIL